MKENENQISLLEKIRQNGDTQVDERRTSILNAAEELFLSKGLENTTMLDIAHKAKISRASLYRYFADRQWVANAVSMRILQRIAATVIDKDPPVDVPTFKKTIIGMIDNFFVLKDAFRFQSMFDNSYTDFSLNNDEAGTWYKTHLDQFGWNSLKQLIAHKNLCQPQFSMIANVTLSYLERMAVRGEIMTTEQGSDIQEELDQFKVFVNSFFESCFLE